jgi:hypothetical protein
LLFRFASLEPIIRAMKLSSACYLVRRISMWQNNHSQIDYFAFFMLLWNPVSFWGDSAGSKIIFQQQKLTIRIMTGSTSRISCKLLFHKLEILTQTSRYIVSFMRFPTLNLEIYTFTTSVHNINTRCK